jgi:hypothetical protein
MTLFVRRSPIPITTTTTTTTTTTGYQVFVQVRRGGHHASTPACRFRSRHPLMKVRIFELG